MEGKLAVTCFWWMAVGYSLRFTYENELGGFILFTCIVFAIVYTIEWE